MIRILVADPLSEEGLALLEQIPDSSVDVLTGLKEPELLSSVSSYDVVIIRSATQMTRNVIRHASQLKLIARAGIGVDNVDVEAASQAGIVVMNTPQGNATTAAEHALSLLLALARQIPQATASMKTGKWEKSKFKGVEVTSKVLGVIGLGNIGQIVASRASGLCMQVIAYDPLLTQEKANELGVKLVGLPTLFESSDFISIHTPLCDATHHLLNAEAFNKMKKGVRVINAARGGIIDEQALLEALQSGKVAGAALDVFEEEPPKADSPLLAHPQVICTPHLGASTNEAQSRVALQVAEQVRDFLTQGEIRNAVNAPNLSGSQLAQLQPAMQMSHMMGAFLAQYSDESPNQITVTWSCHEPNKSHVPILHGAIAGFMSAKEKRSISWLLAPHKAARMGIDVVESYRKTEDTKLATLSIKTAQHHITGALFAHKGPRIIEIDGYEIEALPTAHMLILRNKDVPGVIGKIGTFLGTEGINVSRMQLGLGKTGEALSLWNLDNALKYEQLQSLQTLSPIQMAKQVHLSAY